MRFYDEAIITVESGKGGDGIVTGRREAGIPFGGPSGGNGGKGGSIILKASKDENTLIAYKFKKKFKAKAGENGKSKDQYGADAEDVILLVPIGTLVKDIANDRILHLFSQDNEEFVLAKGGEGGLGNMHFKDSVHQFPHFCLLGEPGQKLEVLLELQLLADVALIGTPSVGKSSIINAISHTKAKVAEYPFTTLIPNLGSVVWKKKTFNVIDIPGLIKGSAQGKGLGNAFLRHVLKSRVFALVVDISRYDSGILEINDLLVEIFSYVQQKFSISEKDVSIKKDGKYLLFVAKQNGEIFLEKRILFVINKYDLVNDQEILDEYQNQLFEDILNFLHSRKILGKITKKDLKENTVVISAITRYGLDNFLDVLIDVFRGLKIKDVYHVNEQLNNNGAIVDKLGYQSSEVIIEDITEYDKSFLIQNHYMDETFLRHVKIRKIAHPRICKLVWMLPWGNEEAEHWFWKTLEGEGYLDKFEEVGIRKGDVLKIISYYSGKEDRYILY